MILTKSRLTIMTKIGIYIKTKGILLSMSSKEKLSELLRTARVTKGIYTSDGELIETYEVRAVGDEVVNHLTDYLIENGVSVGERGDT